MSVPAGVSWKVRALTLKLPPLPLVNPVMLNDWVAAEPAFLLKLPVLTTVAVEPLPSNGLDAVLVSLMMPPVRLFTAAPLYIRTRCAPPMSTVPLLFQVTAPLKAGEPTSVVVPLVFSVPPPTPLSVAPPRVKALLTVRLPAPERVPPVSDRVGVPPPKGVGGAEAPLPPLIHNNPSPVKLVPLKLRVPAVTAR